MASDGHGARMAPGAPTRPPGAARPMEAVAFGGCFGWLHEPAAPVRATTAVILCPGIRRDMSNAYRPLRLVADQLAAAGYPTLRFDYAGTGNADDAASSALWPAWLANVEAAKAWACAQLAIRRVVLVGLRLGATLATLAAAGCCDVAGLVLIEPVVRGKSYLSQLMIEARLRGQPVRPGEAFALDELALDKQTVRQLAAADLRHSALPGTAPVFVFVDDPQPLLTEAMTAWSAQGHAVSSEGLGSLAPLLRPAHQSIGGLPDASALIDWLGQHWQDQATAGARTLVPPAVLRPEGCIETVVRFGAGQRLIGIHSRPAGRPASDLAVVIGNSGGDPHHGYARFSVQLARHLAASGIASLRFDFAGLGDSASLGADGRETGTTVFETDRQPDFDAALDLLSRLGARRFAAYGLCSGAYHALGAALIDERIGALLLVNLPVVTFRLDRPGPASITRRAMAELQRRSVDVFLLYAAGDAGVAPLEQHFGPGGEDLRRLLDPDLAIVPGLDHDLTGAPMRAFAADRMLAFLTSHASCRSEPWRAEPCGTALPARDLPLIPA